MTSLVFTRHRLSALCGDMDAESFKALVEDIRKQRQLEPNRSGRQRGRGWLASVSSVSVPGARTGNASPSGRPRPREVRAGKERASSAHDGRAVRGGSPARCGMDAGSSARGRRKGRHRDTLIQRLGSRRRRREQENGSAGEGPDSAWTRRSARHGVRDAPFAAGQGQEGHAGGGSEGGKAQGKEERSKVAELRNEVSFLKREIETRDVRISELMEEVERLTVERDEALEGGLSWVGSRPIAEAH